MTPATLVRRLVTASANLAVRSKSPPQHSEIGHTNTTTDLACSRFALYFISVVLVMPSRSTNSKATFNVFNCGYFSASLTASSARCRWAWRCSARGFLAAHPLILGNPVGIRKGALPEVVSAASWLAGCAAGSPGAFCVAAFISRPVITVQPPPRQPIRRRNLDPGAHPQRPRQPSLRPDPGGDCANVANRPAPHARHGDRKSVV